MKKNNSKKGSFIFGIGIGLCTVFGLSVADAGEAVLHEKAAVKVQIVALQDNSEASRSPGYDEEKLKRKCSQYFYT